ncbi:MAG: sigma-54-dependent Fis family transcriptional regulator [Deltaproteobacteria bacterium]|nr:sigma-54-dependent Fis family transcriptional regulator [Deltaproteobacteria bacterium]
MKRKAKEPDAAGLSVLVVEDENLLSWSLSKDLSKWGYKPFVAASVAEARSQIAAQKPWAMLLDIRLPDGPGLDLLKEISPEDQRRVIVMSAFGEISTVVEAMRLGAADFLAKPFEPEQLQEALERLRAITMVPSVPSQRDTSLDHLGIVYASPSMAPVIDRLRRFAQTPKSTVLLMGETGVGKSVLARALHRLSNRRDSSFVEVNCAAMPQGLIESELMGHERGAFTDARGTKKGLFEEANGGTLLLDEIGDMPPEMQAKLLHFIETSSFRRLGSTKELKADVRIVTATHRDLTKMVEQGRFREDLYYRIKVLTVEIPPLRERYEDIDLLVGHFLNRFMREADCPPLELAPAASSLLRSYQWPGNVRELKHAVEAAVALANGDRTIHPEHLPLQHIGTADVPTRSQGHPGAEPEAAPAGAEANNGGNLARHELKIALDGSLGLDEMEREILKKALDLCEGNQVKASSLLGVSRHLLRYRLIKHRLI